MSLHLTSHVSIYINHIVGRRLSALNLRGLKSHDHETWHVGPLSILDVHGLSGISIFGRVAPQARLGLIFFVSAESRRFEVALS